MEISNSGVPQRSVLGLVSINIFISDIGSGIKCTCSSLRMTLTCVVWRGVADMPEGWDAIQRDPDRLSSGPGRTS